MPARLTLIVPVQEVSSRGSDITDAELDAEVLTWANSKVRIVMDLSMHSSAASAAKIMAMASTLACLCTWKHSTAFCQQCALDTSQTIV